MIPWILFFVDGSKSLFTEPNTIRKESIAVRAFESVGVTCDVKSPNTPLLILVIGCLYFSKTVLNLPFQY